MIAAVIVTFSAPEAMLTACVRSVIAAGGVDRVLVIDNGGTATLPPDLAAGAEIVRAASNGGFGAGANLGFRIALDGGATVVALLNDDLVVEPGWVAPLLDELAASHVGAAQPLLLLADGGRVNSRGVQLDAAGAGSDIGYGTADTRDATAVDIELFTAGAVAFTADFLRETGGFDERYFLYYEDVDLGVRGRELGFRYRCAPAARVIHRGSASTNQLGDRLVYLRERNRLWCTFRHQPPATVARAVWLSVRRVRWSPRIPHLRALLVGLAGGARRRLERRGSRPRRVADRAG